MPLKKTGGFNDLGNLLPAIPKEPTTVVYQFLDHLSFPHPVTKKKQWNAAVRVPSISDTLDPETGNAIPIALAGGVDITGNLLPNEIRRLEFAPDASDGKVILRIGDGHVSDEELFQYFEICSFNESNPHRNKSVSPIFRRLDFQAEAKAKVMAQIQEQKALQIILNAEMPELVDMANLNNVSADQDEWQIKQALTDVAKKNPDTFLAMVSDEDKPAKSLLASAIAAGAIQIDEAKRALVNTSNGSSIMSLNSVDRGSAMNEFATFVRNAPKSANVLKAIKGLVDAKLKSK